MLEAFSDFCAAFPRLCMFRFWDFYNRYRLQSLIVRFLKARIGPFVIATLSRRVRSCYAERSIRMRSFENDLF